MSSQAEYKARENLLAIRRKRQQEEEDPRKKYAFSEDEDPEEVAIRNLNKIRKRSQDEDVSDKLKELRKKSAERWKTLNMRKTISPVQEALSQNKLREEVAQRRIREVLEEQESAVRKKSQANGLAMSLLKESLGLKTRREEVEKEAAKQRTARREKEKKAAQDRIDAYTQDERKAREVLSQIGMEQTQGRSRTLQDLAEDYSAVTGKEVGQAEAYRLLRQQLEQNQASEYEKERTQKREQLENITDEGFEEKAKAGMEKALKTSEARTTAEGSVQPGNLVPDVFQKVSLFDRDRYEQYQNMTEDEKKVFGYYLETGGKSAAMDYLDTIERDVNARVMQQEEERLSQYAEEHPVLASVSSVPAGWTKGLGYLEAIRQNAENVLTGEKEPVDINSPAFWGSAAQGAIRETVQEDMGGVGQFLYGTGMSMADFLSLLPAGAASLPVMASGAGADTAREVVERGGTSGQAIQMGTIAAAAEYVTEKIGIDRLFSIARAGSSAKKQFIKQVVMEGALPEGTEEVVSDIVNHIADEKIMGELSEESVKMQQYIAAGMSEEEARQQILKENIKDTALSFAGGALSGGIMGAGAYGFGYLERDAIGQSVSDQGQTEVLMDYARNMVDTESARMAQELDGREPTNYQKGLLYEQLMQDAQENPEQAERAFAEAQTGQNADNAEQNEQVQARQRETEGITGGQQEGIPFEEYDPETDRDLFELATRAGERERTARREGWQAQEGQETGRGEKPAIQEGKGEYRANTRSRFSAAVNYQGVAGNVTGIDRVENGKIYVKVNTGDTDIVQPIENVAFENGTTERLYRLAENYGNAGARNFILDYDGGSLENYKKGYDAYYRAGLVEYPQVNIESVYGRMLTLDQQATAYQAGLADREASVVQKIEGYSQAKRGAGKFVDKTGRVPAQERSALSALAQVSGATIVLEPALPRDADGYYQNGEVHISANAEKPAVVVAKHELTHYIQEQTPYGDEYRNFVLQQLTEQDGEALDEIVQKRIDQYQDAGVTLSYEDALDEIVANASEMFLTDDTMINMLAEENPSLAKKILEFIRGLIKDIKEAMKGYAPRSREAQMLNENLEAAQQAEKLWVDAIKHASGQRGKGTAGEGIRYSLGDIEVHINQELLNLVNKVKDMKGKIPTWKKIKISDVGAREMVDIKRLTGVDVQGYEHWIRAEEIRHIWNRHGENGTADRTMKKPEDIACVGYIIENYDKIEPIKALSNRYKNADNSKAKEVAFQKKIGDDIWQVVEAVPDSKAKKLWILSAYKIKKIEPYRAPDVKTPGRTSETKHELGSNNTIPEGGGNSNKRFSLKEPVEETKDLIAVHNITSEKFNKMLEYDGMPMISIAVTKADIGHTDFGDISLLFSKETIDPKNRKNKVYSADAWTPTFPQVEYEENREVGRKIYSRIYDLTEDMPEEYARQARSLVLNLEDEMNRNEGERGVIARAKENIGIKAAYLVEKGIGVEEQTKIERKEMSEEKKAISKRLIAEFGDTLGDLKKIPSKEFYENQGKRIAEIANEITGRTANPSKWRESRLVQSYITRALNDALEYKENGGFREETVRDYQAEERYIKERAAGKEFEDWVENLFAGIEKGRGIRNSKEAYTQSGNRRAFRQTHYEVNAQNIVKAMLEDGDAKSNAGFSAGIKTLRAAASEEFKSMRGIKGESGRLQEIETAEYQEYLDGLSNRLSRVVTEIRDSRKKSPYGNEFLEADQIAKAIEESCENPTTENIRKTLKGRGWTATQAQAEEIAAIIDDVRKMPVNMFEAKPQRVVGYDEIKAAVIPYDLDERTKKNIERLAARYHFEIREYERDNSESRKNAVNGIEGIRFSLKETSEANYEELQEENKSLKEMNSILGGMLKTARGMGPDTDAIRAVGRKILKDYHSDYSLKTFTDNMTNLWNYIAYAKNVNADEVAAATTNMAKGILEQSRENINQEYADQYQYLVREVRRMKLAVPEDFRGDFDQVGGYGAFRKKYFGTLLLGKDGGSIDSYYQSLAERYPELFDETVYTNPADQLIHIAEVMDSLKPKYENPYGMSLDEAAADLAHQIYQSYFDIEAGKGSIDAIRREVVDRERKKYKEYRQKYRDEFKKMKAEYRGQFMERRRENFEKKRYSQNIEKTARRLSNWLLKPTDQNHIPQELRRAVAEFLNTIDMSSKERNVEGELTKRTLKWKALSQAYSNIIKAEAEGKGAEAFLEIDPDIVPMLDNFINRTDQVLLADMSLQDMKDLNKVITAVKKSVESANELLSTERYKKVSDMAEAFLQENSTKKSRKDSPYRVPNMVRNFINLDMIDSRTYFHTLGDAAMDIYGALRSGLDKKIRNVKEAQDYIKKLVGDTDIKEWTGKKAKLHAFKTEAGEELRLTTAQVMSLYRLMQRQQAKEHILIGGVVSERTVARDEKNKRTVSKSDKPVRITPKDLAQITETLTPEQKKIADEITEFFTTTTSAWGNEVSMELYGYRKFSARDYFPIVSNRNYVNSSSGDQQRNVQTLKNMGSTKSTVPHADNPIVIQDIFDVYARQADQMSSYNAFVVPLTDLQKWYNYRGMPDSKYQNSVKQAIERVMGGNGKKYLDTLVRRINSSAEQDMGEAGGRSMAAKMKSAAVGANLRVVFQQPTAIVRAAAVIDPKYLIQGMAKRANMEQMRKYAPIAQWKDWGYFEMDTGRQMKDVILDNEGIRDKAMELAGKADNITWGRIWNAAVAETKDKTDLKPGSEEFYQAAGKRFSEIIDQTQVVDSILHRSSAMIQGSWMMKTATSFMSEPLKTYNMLYDAVVNTKGGRRASAKRVAQVYTIITISNALNAVMQTLVDVWRDDDEETAWFDAETWKENFISNVNPLGYFPFLKEIPSIIQGYDVDRPEMTGIVDAIQHGLKWGKYFAGDSQYTIPGLIKDALKPLSTLTGVPLNAAVREVESMGDIAVWIYRHATGKESVRAEYAIKKIFYDMSYDKNRSVFAGYYARALDVGDTKLAKEIYNDMLRAGNGADQIEKAEQTYRKKRAKASLEGNPLLEMGEKAYREGDMEEFQKVMDAAKAEGILPEEFLEAMGASEKEEEGDHAGGIDIEEPGQQEVDEEYIKKQTGKKDTAELFSYLYLAIESEDRDREKELRKELKEAGVKDAEIDAGILEARNRQAALNGETAYDYDTLYAYLVSEGKNGKTYREIEKGLKKYGKEDGNIKSAMKSRAKKDYIAAAVRGNEKQTETYAKILRNLGMSNRDILDLIE